MIDIHEGELANMLPYSMTNVESQSVSYALKMAIWRLLDAADKTRAWVDTDHAPEAVLDILAVELRVPYYDQDGDISVKREIIKNALLWHMTAGTPSAVQKLLNTVLGDGETEVVEWFNFTDGDNRPGYFDIVTTANFTEESFDNILKALAKVKNVRSHLRKIIVKRDLKQKIFIGVAGYTREARYAVLDGFSRKDSVDKKVKLSTGMVARGKLKII